MSIVTQSLHDRHHHHRRFLFLASQISLLSLLSLFDTVFSYQLLKMSTKATTPPSLTANDRNIFHLSHRSNNILTPDTIALSSTTTTSTKVSIQPTLFLHGLDSSSQTWNTVLSNLEYLGVAVDLRGCGRSDLGDPVEFSPDAIVEDLFRFVMDHAMFRAFGKEGVMGS